MHDQGAGIVAGSDTQEFFDHYDRTRTPLAVTSHARQYLNRSGEVIDHEQRAQKMTSWDLVYHLLRANFDGVKSSYANPPSKDQSHGTVQYRYGRTVTSVEDLGPEQGVRITTKDTTNQDAPPETTEADLLIAADGASSTIRALLLPSVQRAYAGYVAWRGTCPESELSTSTLVEKFTFYHKSGTQILAYLIPGRGGTLVPGERLMNWVWYVNYEEDSDELRDVLTDADGKMHRITLPPGGVRDEVWERIKVKARSELPPPFAEAVEKTGTPFVQAITDVIAERASFWDGRLLLTGDALAGFRPHTAASTSQAAYDAELVAALVDGKLGLDEWQRKAMAFAKEVQRTGVKLGDRSQFGVHPLNG